MSLLDEINDMIDESGLNKRILAESLQKPHSTLKRELNPYDEGAKAGLELLVPSMEVCKSIRPLEYLAARFGYRLVKLEYLSIEDSPAGGFVMAAQDAVHRFLMQVKTDRTPYTKLDFPLRKAIEALEAVFVAVRAEQAGKQVALSISDPAARQFDVPSPLEKMVNLFKNRRK